MEKAFDPARFKEQERAGFNFVADRYEETATSSLPARERMLALAELREGMRALDVATGPGLIAREVARLVGPSGSVVGVDIAEEALARARRRAAEENLPQVHFEVADAEALHFADQSFDRVFCSQGLMHFPHAEQAVREFKRVLKPGGKFLASVWGEESEVPFLTVAISNMTRNLPPPKVERPSMFRYGSRDALEKLVQQAGLGEIEIEPVTLQIILPTPEIYWEKFLGAAGIATVALAKLPQELQDHLAKDVVNDLRPYKKAFGYELDSVLMVVSAVA